MSKPVPTPPPTPAPDPLADLRQGMEPQLPSLTGPPVSILGNGDTGQVEPEALTIRPMVTEEVHLEMVAEAVAAFHQDPTSQGFLHGGGQCGCRYIAALALRAAVPVMTAEDMEERDLEPVGGSGE